jgi:hypothetical protein
MSKPETVLARLGRLEREATKGPWYKVGPLTEEEAGRAGGEPATIEHAWTDDDVAGTVDVLDCPSEDDLELISEARNALPALLAVVEAARNGPYRCR